MKIDREEVMRNFNRHPNYDDELPDEMFNLIKHCATNNDKVGLTEMMRISVNLTRQECATSTLELLSKQQAEHEALLDNVSNILTRNRREILAYYMADNKEALELIKQAKK